MSRTTPDRLFISAGEPSGDRFAGEVAAQLRSRRPDLVLEGCGGPWMAKAGVELQWDATRMATIGFGAALGAIPRHLRLLLAIVRHAAGRYRAAVLVDYPGFHLRLGKALRARGVPVVQLVAPQLWAWRPRRLEQLRAAADAVGAILPFEPAWFAERGLEVTFLGHPAVDRSVPISAATRAAMGLPERGPVLGIFPGSRPGEVDRHWPLMRDVALRLLGEGTCHVAVVAAVHGASYPDPGPIRVVHERAAEVLAGSTAALVKSGTTSLESACALVPHSVVYRASRLSYEIGRRFLTVPWISLVNLVAGEEVVPEHWRLPLASTDIADRLRPLLDGDGAAARRQREKLERVRALLGPGGAAGRAADLVLSVAGC